MARQKPDYGVAVDPVTRTCRYTSASAIMTFNPEQHGGCNRAWWFEKVCGRKKPKTQALDTGGEVHEQIEVYEKTGQDVLGPIARSAKHFVPKVGPGILIEHEFGDERLVKVYADYRLLVASLERGELTQAQVQSWRRAHVPASALTPHDVPIVGYIDVVNLRDHWLDDDGQVQPMPSYQKEVVDWKTTSAMEYTKHHLHLLDQMTIYGEWVRREFSGVEQVRLSHGYMLTRGSGAQKRTTLISVDALERRWKAVEEQVLRLTQVARETDVNKVEPNYSSCNAFGWRGCPHKAVCPRPPDRTFDDILGGDVSMSMLAMLGGGDAAGSSGMPPGAPPMLGAEVDAAKQQLLAAEQAPCATCAQALMPGTTHSGADGVIWHLVSNPPHVARAALAVSAPAPAAAAAPAGMMGMFAAAGAPALPAAAAAPAPAVSAPAPAAAAAPAGMMGMFAAAGAPALPAAAAAPAPAVSAPAPAAAAAPAGMMGMFAAAGAPALPAAAAAPAPAVSAPAPAAAAAPAGMMGMFAAAGAPALPAIAAPGSTVPLGAPVAVVPPDAPASTPTASALTVPAGTVLSPAVAGAVATHEAAAAAAAAAGAPPTTAGATPAAAGGATPAAGATEKKKRSSRKNPDATAQGSDELTLYVDCSVVGIETQDLELYVATIVKQLADAASLYDIRLGEGDHKFAYGKWEGYLSAAVKQHPPTGHCSIVVGGDKIKQVVVSALCPLATGGVVRGIAQ